MNRGSIAATLVFAAASFAAREARAAAPSLTVGDDVSACPGAAELRAAVARHLGRDPFEGPQAPRAAVAVRRRGEELFAEVLVERQGTPARARVITGDTCGDLVRAAALVVALAIEEDEQPEKPAPPPEPPVVPDPRPDAREGTDARSRPLRQDRVSAVLFGTTTVGQLPRASTGAGLSLRARVVDTVTLSAKGIYLPPAAMPDDTFAMRLYGGGAGVCWEPLGTLGASVIGCAHLMGGGLEVTRASTPMRQADTKAFVATALSAGARARAVGPLVVEGTIETTIPFAHPTFLTASCPASGFEQPFATVAFALGAGVSLP